jgi:hypothetical protein
MAAKADRASTVDPPDGFRIDRALPLGRHPIVDAFPGIDQTDTARRHLPDDAARRKLYRETQVELVPDDIWMYVAPWHLPKGIRRRWSPKVTPGVDCIVIGEAHLRQSPGLILFLDIFHELCHVVQRQAGRELFDQKVSYVRRATEIEAYRFALDEARRLGASNASLREYLKVEWVTEEELSELYESLGVGGRG